MADDFLDLALILRSAAGLSIAIFDRSCRFTALIGDTQLRHELGRTVGEGNEETGERLLKAALDAIHSEQVTSLDVEIAGRIYEQRICPVRHHQFGIIGGAVYGWDITRRVSGQDSERPPPVEHRLRSSGQHRLALPKSQRAGDHPTKGSPRASDQPKGSPRSRKPP